MKKIFALFAIAAMVAVACSKDDDKKDDNKDKEKDPPKEYTGPEQGTSDWSVIGALLETNWDTDFVMAQSGDIYVLKNVKLTAADEFKVRFQKAWDVNRGDAFSELGKGFPVTQNGANVKPGLDGFYDIYYNAAKEQMAVVALNGTPTWSEGPVAAAITIDGTFDDWAALPAGSFSKTYGDEDATHPALTHCKVYADPNFIFVYFEYDKEQIAYEPGVEHVPFHCYINTDGDASTGGFGDEFADACSDVCLEGFIYPEGTEIGSYDPGVYDWQLGPNESGWGWTGENLLPDGGLCAGAGVEGKYEFSIDRAILASLGFPVADEFSIGFDIQQAWDSVGILPNAAPSEENASGVVDSLPVKTIK